MSPFGQLHMGYVWKEVKEEIIVFRMFSDVTQEKIKSVVDLLMQEDLSGTRTYFDYQVFFGMKMKILDFHGLCQNKIHKAAKEKSNSSSM